MPRRSSARGPTAKDGPPNAAAVEIPGAILCRAFVLASEVEFGSLLLRHRNFIHFDISAVARPPGGRVRCVAHCLFATQVAPNRARRLGGHYGAIERWYTVDQGSRAVVAVPTRFVWFLQWTLRRRNPEMRARYLRPEAYFLELVWAKPDGADEPCEQETGHTWSCVWQQLGEVWARPGKSGTEWKKIGEAVPGDWDRLSTLHERLQVHIGRGKIRSLV